MDPGGSSLSAEPGAMGIRQLREELRSRGVDTSGCLYKTDLVALLLENMALAPAAAPCPTEPQPAASGQGVPREGVAPRSSVAGSSSSSGAGNQATRQKERMFMCQTCMKRDEGVELLKCSKCKNAHYCSKECQIAGWPAHKPICQMNQKMKKIATETLGPEASAAFEAWLKRIKPLATIAGASALWPSRADTHVLVLSFVQDQQQGSQLPTFSVLPEYEIMTIEEANELLAHVGGIFGGGPQPPAPPGRTLVVLVSDFQIRLFSTGLPPNVQADIRSGKRVFPHVSACVQLLNSGAQV